MSFSPSPPSDAHARILARIRASEDACLAVYLRERDKRPHWPRTFAQAVQHPMTAAAILLLAVHGPSPPVRRPVQHEPIEESYQPGQLNRPATRQPQHGRRGFSQLDFKSRAAGERDEGDEGDA